MIRTALITLALAALALHGLGLLVAAIEAEESYRAEQVRALQDIHL